MPPLPPGVQSPPLWGVPEHIEEIFTAAGAKPAIARVGPFVIARQVLEPQQRWAEFLGVFGDLIRWFNQAPDGSAQIRSDYFLITVDR
jgi:hypothetical protein